MEREKKILYLFVYWLFTLLLVFFVGISNIFAAEYPLNYETYQRYYDNTGTLTQVNSTWNESLLSYVSGSLTTVADSTGAAWLVSSPIPMLKDHQYSISFAFEDRNNITLSSKNKISISNTVNGAVTAYNNSTYNADTLYSKVTGNTILSFIFKANTNSSFIVIPWTTTSRVTQNYVVTKIIMEDLGSSGLSEEQLNSSINNQTNILNNSIQNSVDSITGSITETEDNINQNIDDMEQSIIDSNKETQDVIKDQFNTCRESVNLFNINGNYVNATGTSYIINGDSLTINGDLYSIGPFINVKPNTDYTISIDSISSNNLGQFNISLYNGTTSTYLIQGNKNNKKLTITTNSDTTQIRIYFYGTATYNKIQVQEGSVATDYEPYGEEICSNKIDEANETSKGILGKIGDLISYINPRSENFFVYKLIDLLMELLKSLFIPEEGYFENWFNTLKVFFEEKLGFLATPFTLIIDFVNRYLSLNPQSDIIINIPDITVPNFENHIIVHSTSFNWSELLNSKDSLKLLWELYLSFVDVFLILNFINLCENKYNRIFGGDTTPYEYYTVEDSYNVDVNTGEVLNQRRNERRTVRKKVS